MDPSSYTNLASGIAELGLVACEERIDKMLLFLQLIEKWNKAYNLTAIRRAEEMVSLHLLDSLAAVPYVSGQRVIDVGTGAGLPGIPLAICLPEKDFVLLDSNAKKTRFVQQAVIELGLKNVTVCQERAEFYQPEPKFDVVVTRAFASLWDIVLLTSHLLTGTGTLLAMKGRVAESDTSGIEADCSVIPLNVPGLMAERCLVKIDSLAQAGQIMWEK